VGEVAVGIRPQKMEKERADAMSFLLDRDALFLIAKQEYGPKWNEKDTTWKMEHELRL